MVTDHDLSRFYQFLSSFCRLLYIYIPSWWFGTCLIFPYIGKNNPNWLSYFFRGVVWNHQPVIVLLICSRQPCFDFLRWNQEGTENRHSAESHKRCSFELAVPGQSAAETMLLGRWKRENLRKLAGKNSECVVKTVIFTTHDWEC